MSEPNGGGTPTNEPDIQRTQFPVGERVATLESEVKHNATKEDVADLKTGISDLRAEIKTDFADLEKAASNRHSNLITWIATIVVLVVISLFKALSSSP